MRRVLTDGQKASGIRCSSHKRKVSSQVSIRSLRTFTASQSTQIEKWHAPSIASSSRSQPPDSDQLASYFHSCNLASLYYLCMSEKLIEFLISAITAGGYPAVILLMAIQSACIPIPSEIIMPLAGDALAHSQWDLIVLATVASLASNLGSIPAYWVGARGGRPMVERYGSYLLLSRRDLDLVDRFFARYGSIAVLVGRMLPIVRTFIAFPAGVAKMNQLRFHIYTFLGSWPWCYALAYVGMKLGAQWNTNPQFKAIFHRFHLAVEAAIILAIILFVVSHWKNRIRVEEA
jgi:membrane protein DedA with SNARE-associated domain